MILSIIFALNLSLLFIHEMEAIRYKEWKMFIILKDMEENKAYTVFLLLHIPLYVSYLLLLMSSFFNVAYYIADIFLIAHLLIHICFRNHKDNRFNNTISMSIITLMGILSTIHLVGIIIAM